MSEPRVLVAGSAPLRERVPRLDGITVVDDSTTADCAVTDDPMDLDALLPTVVVTDDVDAVSRPVAGFCRADAPDVHLRDQLRLAARHGPAAARSKAERLHDVTRRMVACDDPDEVFELAAEAAERVLDLDLCYLGEADGEVFQPKAVSSGMTEENYNERMGVDEGIAGRTYQTDESTLIEDAAADADDAEPADDAYRSALSVPIGDLGVFQAAAYEPEAFDEYDRELVELLMSHVGETVTRLRTEARLRERNETIEGLHATTAEMLTCETPAALYETVVDAAERVLEFEVCVVGMLNDDGLVELVAASDSPIPPPIGTTWPPDRGLVGETFRTGESILVDDVLADERADPYDDTYRSALSVPIGDTGILQAIAAEPGVYDENDRELAELLASQAGTALARVRAEQDLRAERDRLAEFASVLSHDLRNPLNTARGYLELAEETGDPDHFDRVDESLARMERIVDDVLTLARNPVVGETAPVALGDAVAQAADAVGLDAAAVQGEDVTVEADRDRLLRLLENLLANALEHAGPDPHVEVGPLPDGGFYVADDGPGIPPEKREQVFDSGYTTNRAGTGLGLAIVRAIAEAHGWSVDVAESDGGGARFEVRT